MIYRNQSKSQYCYVNSLYKIRLESLLLPARCVSSEELGKVFAMLASLESVVPIAASAISEQRRRKDEWDRMQVVWSSI